MVVVRRRTRVTITEALGLGGSGGQLCVLFFVAMIAMSLRNPLPTIVAEIRTVLDDFSGDYLDFRSLRAKLIDTIENENHRVIVVSTGGVGSSDFTDYLAVAGVNPGRSNNWRYGLVHAPKPIPLKQGSKSHELLTAFVYIYPTDPLVAICSTTRRGLGRKNFRLLTRGTHLAWLSWIAAWISPWHYSDLRLLQAMHMQFTAWTKEASLARNVIVLSHNQTHSVGCIRRICERLGTCSRAPPKLHHRYTTADSPCVARLRKSLGPRHKRMVEDMESYTTVCS